MIKMGVLSLPPGKYYVNLKQNILNSCEDNKDWSELLKSNLYNDLVAAGIDCDGDIFLSVSLTPLEAEERHVTKVPIEYFIGRNIRTF